MAKIAAPLVKLSNGRNFPGFGLGTWQAQAGEVGTAIKNAIDIGYRHIDCAMVYGNEKEIGVAINEKIREGAVKREDLFVTSKLWNTFHRPEMVETACRKTLKDLDLSYVDLYLVHWPVAFKVGDDMFPKDTEGNFLTEDVDITETYKAMEKCVTLGLAKSIGVSNFNADQIARVLKIATVKPVVNQVECHPYLQQKKLIKFCSERGLTVTAYCPLGAPNQTNAAPGKKNILDNATLKALADKYNKSVAQIALRFLVQTGVVPIPKSVKKERLLENISVFDFELSKEDFASIEQLDCNGRVVPFAPGKNHKEFPFAAEF